jgi:phosphoribosylformimino-5-aminoimidazole carboxamide ribotide isomerase
MIPMQVLPVLDLLSGQVVRGVGGRRSEYRPIVSRLTASAAPLDVARAFAEHFGRRHFYLADLDAIAGAEPAWPTYAALRAEGFALWVDAGASGPEQAERLGGAVETVVAGLETLSGPDALAEMVAALGERLVFSLDLRDGAPLGACSRWPEGEGWAIAQEAITRGVKRLLVLDLARVGGASGTGTLELCARLAAAHPGLEISAGGGVRNLDDLRNLARAGVRVALVASALHDGLLGRADLDLVGP